MIAPSEAELGQSDLTATLTAPEATVTYTWSITGGTILGSKTGTAVTFSADAEGTMTLTCQAVKGTEEKTGLATVRVRSTPPKTPQIQVVSSVSSGATGLTATVAQPQSGTQYAWSIVNGSITAGAATTGITFTAGSVGSLTLNCVATNKAGTASSQAVVQVVALAPFAPVITAPAQVISQSINNPAGIQPQTGCTYAWTVSGGTITGGQGTPAITFTAGAAGSLQVGCTVTNQDFVGVSSTATVQVISLAPVLSAPTSISASSTGQTASVTLPLSGVQYAWTITNGTITAGAQSSQVTFSAGSAGTLTLVCTATSSSSSASSQATVSVVPSAPTTPTITAPSQVNAQSTNNNASVQAQAGCTYAWTISGGVISSGQGTNALVFSAGAAGTLQLGCTVTNTSNVSASAQKSVSVVNPAPQALSYYGSGLNSDELNNLPVGDNWGGTYNQECSFRFRAKNSGFLQAIRPFFIWSYTKAGYQAGTGGTIQVKIQTDDGTSNHYPSGTTLATLVYANPVNDTIGCYPLLTFSSGAQLTAGQLYHVVFTNIDANPVANWISLDVAWMSTVSNPMQPTVSDLDQAILLRKATTGIWSLLKQNTPIIELDFADGSSQGQGYMDFWMSAPKTISGAASVRQTFTVTGSDRTVTSAAIRVRYVSGPSPITIRLEKGDGTLIDQGTVGNMPVTPSGSAGSWAKVTFASGRTLQVGQTYHLVVSAPSDSTYIAHTMRKGTDKGYKATTLFTDGYAQFNSGSGWTGWDSSGQLNRKDADLQFYFEVP